MIGNGQETSGAANKRGTQQETKPVQAMRYVAWMLYMCVRVFVFSFFVSDVGIHWNIHVNEIVHCTEYYQFEYMAKEMAYLAHSALGLLLAGLSSDRHSCQIRNVCNQQNKMQSR